MDTRSATAMDRTRRPTFVSRVRAAINPDPSATGPDVWSGAFAQIVLISLAAGLYFTVRDITKDQAALAFANADSLVRFEAALGLNHEAAWQSLILDKDWVITGCNWMYIYGHWPVIVFTLVYTFVCSRREYLTFRDAIIFSGAIGLVFFALYPVAPPRLADPSSFFDSLELSKSYKVLQPQGIVNRYAALPSFHVGWNLLAAVAMWNAKGLHRLRPIAVLMPIAMMVSVVLTANHWVVDVFAGALIAMTGLAAARWLRNRRSSAHPTTLDATAADPQSASASAESPARLTSSR